MMDLFYLGVPVSHEGVTVNQYENTRSRTGERKGIQELIAVDVSRGSLVDAFVPSPDFFSTRTLKLKRLKVT